MSESKEEPLALFFTVEEAARELEVTESSIRRMIALGKLESRKANEQELASLLTNRRIQGVPHTGINLIHQDTLARAKLRRKRSRPQMKRS